MLCGREHLHVCRYAVGRASGSTKTKWLIYDHLIGLADAFAQEIGITWPSSDLLLGCSLLSMFAFLNRKVMSHAVVA